MSVVELVAISKHYGEVAALDAVDLRIGDGEFFALLGPSGSGKTTLLRAIAGFVTPDRGEIRVDGEDMRRTPAHRRSIGMVFQHYALFPHMTVAENVAFGLSVRGVPQAQTRNRVGEMLSLVELEGLERRRPSQLSGGQQQRVALARALVTRPRVLLLDEPLGALDKRLRRQMQVELKQIQREVGITTVFVTHDQEEALTLSDRIALLNHGAVVHCDTPETVYERPRSVFAADFLGDANFFAGRSATPRDGLTAVVTEAGETLLAGGAPLPPGRKVTLAVRPEKLRIESAGTAVPPALNRIDGRVTRRIYAGASTTYRIAGAAGELVVFAQNRDLSAAAEGDRITVCWRPADTVVLES